MTKAERSRNLRYKRPALASMGFEAMRYELEQISDKCSDIHWWTDTDEETLLNALDGDEEDAFEFKLAFSKLDTACDRILSEIWDNCIDAETFDNCTVALIGNRYNMVGYDALEEDYFALTAYDEHLAEQEAGKRIMRMTKKEILSTIGQCFGILMAYLDVRQRFDYLSATFDILRDQNTSLLDTIKEIEKLYEESQDDWQESGRFDKLLDALPEETWII